MNAVEQLLKEYTVDYVTNFIEEGGYVEVNKYNTTSSHFIWNNPTNVLYEADISDSIRLTLKLSKGVDNGVVSLDDEEKFEGTYEESKSYYAGIAVLGDFWVFRVSGEL